MKTIYYNKIFFLILILIVSLNKNVLGQTGFNTEGLEETETIYEKKKEKISENNFKDFWNKHFSAEVGFLTLPSMGLDISGKGVVPIMPPFFSLYVPVKGTGTASKNMLYGKLSYNSEHDSRIGTSYLGFETRFDIFKDNVEIDNITVDTRDIDGNVTELNGEEYDQDGNYISIEEAYIEQDFFNRKFALTGGRRKLIWGQFDLYSPINYALPLRASGLDISNIAQKTNINISNVTNNKMLSGVSGLKGDAALGQDLVGLKLFPVSNLMIESYLIPKIRFSPYMQEEVIDKGYITWELVDYDPFFNEYIYDYKTEKFNLTNGDDETQYAARAMFYPNWGTLGLSYFKGWDTNSTFNYAKIKQSEIPGVPADTYYIDNQMGVNKKEIFGLEFSIPVRSWNIKGEYARYNRNDMLTFYNLVDTPASLSSKEKTFFDWVINENNGDLYIPITQDIAGVGISNNNINSNIFVVPNLVDIGVFNKFSVVYEDKNDEKGYNLWSDAYGIKNESNMFISMHVNWNLTRDKKTKIGFTYSNEDSNNSNVFYITKDFKDTFKITAAYLSTNMNANVSYRNDAFQVNGNSSLTINGFMLNASAKF